MIILDDREEGIGLGIMNLGEICWERKEEGS
jgi:hypothetical protein